MTMPSKTIITPATWSSSLGVRLTSDHAADAVEVALRRFEAQAAIIARLKESVEAVEKQQKEIARRSGAFDALSRAFSRKLTGRSL